MKRTIFLISLIGISGVNAAVHVRGHMTKKGRYVQGYFKSSADHTKVDNFSHEGNYNPYNGKRGTRR